MAIRMGLCPKHGRTRFVVTDGHHFKQTVYDASGAHRVMDLEDSRNYECWKCRMQKAGIWKGKAKPNRPESWTEKNEEDLTYLVDEIFKECGPQAVSDTRKACEMGEKALQEAARDE